MAILSICVPTYNRSKYLSNLLKNFHDLTKKIGDDIEFCISDNGSTDNTKDVIENYSFLKNLKTHFHESNMGSAFNLVYAAGMSSSVWTLVIGDDDLILEDGILNLLSFLSSNEASRLSYILLNTKIIGGRLFNFKGGRISSNEIKNIFVKNFDDFGFLGSHLMSRKVVQQMQCREIDELRGWVSISMFSFYIAKNDIYHFNQPVVHQSPAPNSLQWKPVDWLKLIIRRTEHCCHSFILNDQAHFQRKLSKKYFWSKSFISEAIISTTFQKDATKKAILQIDFNKLGFSKLNKFLFLIFYKLIFLVPSFLILAVIRLVKGSNFVSHYKKLLQPSSNDGVLRDIDIV